MTLTFPIESKHLFPLRPLLTLPQLLHFIDQGLLNWKGFHKLTCTSATECYSINNRNGIKNDNYADMVFIKKTNKLKDQTVQTKAGQNLYADFNFGWRVAATMVNGLIKFDGKSFNQQIKGMEV